MAADGRTVMQLIGGSADFVIDLRGQASGSYAVFIGMADGGTSAVKLLKR